MQNFPVGEEITALCIDLFQNLAPSLENSVDQDQLVASDEAR